MSEKASQLRIGIFVVVGVAILFGALFLFGIPRSASLDGLPGAHADPDE